MTTDKELVESVAISLCLYVDGRRRSGLAEEIWLGLTETYKDAYREQACHAIEAYKLVEQKSSNL